MTDGNTKSMVTRCRQTRQTLTLW